MLPRRFVAALVLGLAAAGCQVSEPTPEDWQATGFRKGDPFPAGSDFDAEVDVADFLRRNRFPGAEVRTAEGRTSSMRHISTGVRQARADPGFVDQGGKRQVLQGGVCRRNQFT